VEREEAMTGTPPLVAWLRSVDEESMYQEPATTKQRCEQAAEVIEALLSALENLCIHVGMGWELDEVMEKAKQAIAKTRGENP
jgi:hypothetical protein